MIGLVRSTVSPSSSSMRRSTPWVLGCWGPMLMIIVSSGDGPSALRSPASASDRRRTLPTSRSSSGAFIPLREVVISCAPSPVSAANPGFTPPAALPGIGHALELHRDLALGVVLAERVADPVLRHEDPGQVGMVLEADAEHVEDLSLHRLGAGMDVEQRRHDRVVLGDLDPQP